jgi:hypothetical protein
MQVDSLQPKSTLQISHHSNLNHPVHMKQRPQLDRQKINQYNKYTSRAHLRNRTNFLFLLGYPFHLIKHAIELLEGSMRVEPIPEECIPVGCWELSMSELVQQQLSPL